MKRIEDAFKEFTSRDDVAIVLINQFIANMIRHLIANYTAVSSMLPQRQRPAWRQPQLLSAGAPCQHCT